MPRIPIRLIYTQISARYPPTKELHVGSQSGHMCVLDLDSCRQVSHDGILPSKDHTSIGHPCLRIYSRWVLCGHKCPRFHGGGRLPTTLLRMRDINQVRMSSMLLGLVTSSLANGCHVRRPILVLVFQPGWTELTGLTSITGYHQWADRFVFAGERPRLILTRTTRSPPSRVLVPSCSFHCYPLPHAL